jgi:hypothetical protein
MCVVVVGVDPFGQYILVEYKKHAFPSVRVCYWPRRWATFGSGTYADISFGPLLSSPAMEVSEQYGRRQVKASFHAMMTTVLLLSSMPRLLLF